LEFDQHCLAQSSCPVEGTAKGFASVRLVITATITKPTQVRTVWLFPTHKPARGWLLTPLCMLTVLPWLRAGFPSLASVVTARVASLEVLPTAATSAERSTRAWSRPFSAAADTPLVKPTEPGPEDCCQVRASTKLFVAVTNQAIFAVGQAGPCPDTDQRQAADPMPCILTAL